MTVNLTQRDETLNEIIDFCEEVKSVWCRKEGAHARGYREALADVIAHCRDKLGYTGHMPLEVPNQSEQAHTMTCTLDAAISGCRYQCSCGYWTADKDEAETHFKENS